MQSLLTYLECDGAGIFATPGNTMGAGNPGPTGEDTLSEPLAQGMDTNKAKAKKQKTKKKMKDLKDFLKESLEDINEARTNGRCVWEVYDRGANNQVKTSKFFAKDLYDAVYKLVEHCRFYFDVDAFTDPDYDDDPKTSLYLDKNASKADRDKVAERALARIEAQNGDGCDFVYTFEWNGKTYIDNGSPEETW